MSSTAADESGGDDGGGGPEILLTETVGAFEITVLQGGDAMEVYDWLGANGYQQDPDALPILGEYIDEGLLFGAIKLSGGADVDEIHPIVLRFVGDEPCVPLRLTRIAAVDDMAVRAFFLGEARMVPLNYRHVLVNQVEVNWLAPTNYPEVVTLAVDEENADGRAFVTEYAGTSSVVPTGGLFSASWDAQAFAGADVSTVGTTLQAQSLLVCDDFSGCAFTHPLIEGLLGEYVTPPDGVPSADFWANFDAYSVDTSAWDGAAFAANMATRIVEPGMHAMELLGAHSYLTRMFTTISPAEMTEDPQFWENAALPDVPNLLNGTLRMLCNNDRVFTLPDGREVYLPSGTTWPDFPSMPQSEMIEAVPNAGAPMTLTDNGALIDEILAAWNAAHGWPASGGDGSGSASASASGSGSDSDGSSSAGADATTERGCGCVADARAMPWWSLIVLFGLRRRRIC